MKPFELLLDQKEIAHRISQLGRQITNDYADRKPVLVGVLKGCMVFLSDLIRQINLPLEIEFIAAASYRKGTRPEQEVVFGSPIPISLRDRHVLIVEGVVESGRTAISILETVNKQEPASVEIVTLIDKPGSHRSTLNVKYKGFSLGNEFVIGFGLDNTQKYRNLPFIGKLIDM